MDAKYKGDERWHPGCHKKMPPQKTGRGGATLINGFRFLRGRKNRYVLHAHPLRLTLITCRDQRKKRKFNKKLDGPEMKIKGFSCPEIYEKEITIKNDALKVDPEWSSDIFILLPVK